MRCHRVPSLLFGLASPLLLVALAASVRAQPAVSSLWPPDLGKVWTYNAVLVDGAGTPATTFDLTLALTSATVVNGGVDVLVLQAASTYMGAGVSAADPSSTAGQLSPPAGFWSDLWTARPDLRGAILRARRAERSAAKKQRVPFDAVGDGLLRVTSDTVGLWREAIADWAWIYATAPLTPGATFTLQLVPDLASDVFLHGTVTSTAQSVSVGAGTFSNAVRIDDSIDFGLVQITDEFGNLLGTARSETTITLDFVPGLGLAQLVEDFVPAVQADCGGPCPPPFDQLGVVQRHGELSLGETPVPDRDRSWGAVKAGFTSR